MRFMIKMRSNLVGFGLILGILAALEFFDASQSTKLWFIAIAGVALFNLEEEKKEEKRIEIVMKQNERLDALELQQYKLRDANERIHELEKEFERINQLETIKIDSTIEMILEKVKEDYGEQKAKEARKVFYD